MSGKESKTPMNSTAASRIQSSEASKTDGGVKSGSFASRAQSAAATHENKASSTNKK